MSPDLPEEPPAAFELEPALERLDGLAQDVAGRLRAPHFRDEAARPLVRAVRNILTRCFHACESLRRPPAEADAAHGPTDEAEREAPAEIDAAEDAAPSDLDEVVDADIAARRKVYMIERELDAAAQLMADTSPDEARLAQRRSLRFFELVNVEPPAVTRVRCLQPRAVKTPGSLSWKLWDFTDHIEDRTQRFLDVLAGLDEPGQDHGEVREYGQLLPDFWDLELITRKKNKKKK